jgi:mannose-6-phosphate isomerase-like protein (cupin superfamily)
VLKKSLRFGKGFRVVRGNRASQAAEMVLAPGDTEGATDNRHRGADQWLFVLSGQGEAHIEGREKHQVRNTGRTLLRTLNFYVPPAYRQDGDPLPRGRK